MGTPPIEFGSIGMADSLILMIMALVVFGPRRLPQIGRQIGKLMYEFRKASNDFKFQMEEELRMAEDADRRKQEEERRKQLALATPAQESVSADPPPATVNTIESPYPGENQYPETTAAETARTEDAAAHTGDTTLQVLPPSTGEIVPATRPARLGGSMEPTAESIDAGESHAAAEPEAAGQAEEPTGPRVEAEAEDANTPERTGSTTESSAPESSAPATEAVSHHG